MASSTTPNYQKLFGKQPNMITSSEKLRLIIQFIY